MALGFLLLLLGAAPAAAFLDRGRGLHLFQLPETRSDLHHASVALHGGNRWRMLQPRDGVYPELHDAHEFVGTTQLGFIAFNVRLLSSRFPGPYPLPVSFPYLSCASPPPLTPSLHLPTPPRRSLPSSRAPRFRRTTTRTC